MTNKEFYEIFREYTSRNYCKGTSNPWNSQIKCHFLVLFGSKDISETDHHDINDVYSEMENEGYAGNTISGAYSAIHAYFRIAHLLGYVKENPAPLSKVIHPVK